MKIKIICILIVMLFISSISPIMGAIQVNQSVKNLEKNLENLYSEKTGKLSNDEYTIIDLGTLGGSWSYAGGLNEECHIVGISAVYNSAQHAFVWICDTMTDMGTPEGFLVSGAVNVNDNGQVAGYANGQYQSQYAYLWEDGNWTYLGTLPDLDYSAPYDINNLGQIVGHSFMLGPGGGSLAWIYEDGDMSELGTLGGDRSTAFGINDEGQVVGSSRTSNNYTHAFLWEDEEMIDLGVLPDEDNSAAYDINENGQICGASSHTLNQYPFPTYVTACVWDGDEIIEIEKLPGYNRNNAAGGINDLGQVVGYSSDNGNNPHPFIWEDGYLTDLNDLIPEGSGWELKNAADINEKGEIVGYGKINGETHGYLLKPPQENLPPKKPSNPLPSDGATNMELNLTLSVKVTDTNMDSMTVRFYDASNDNLIGTDYGVPSGDTAFAFWYDLSPETTYSWYTVADDGEYTNQSDTWSFTTCCVNMPPYIPIGPIPINGATGVGLNPTLSVEVNDPDGDSLSVSFYNASDDSLIGTEGDILSGERAYVVWPDLSPSVSYSWYTIVDDGEYTNQSNTWSFSTDSENYAPSKPTDPSPAESAIDVGLNPTLSVEVNDPDSDTMTVSFYDASDDSLIGIEEDIISGERAYTNWNDLSPLTNYSWYTIADDGEYTNQSDTWSFTTVADNNAPFKPTNPTPKNDATGIDLNPTLSVEVNDPDGDSMTVSFYDASDDSIIGTINGVPSGDSAYVEWFNLDPLSIYSWYAVADDGEYTTQSNSWSFITIPDPDNNAPNTPIISGTTDGKTDTEYTYKFKSVDPDGNELVYCIQWGDDSGEICIGPFESGKEASLTHVYEEKGTYTIRVKAEDSNEAESDWGELIVKMPKSASSQINFRIINWLLERFPNAFPILRFIQRH
jgi:probable HAF family extracellular repeat protein